jgi:probable rRNA maturation factor
LLQVNIIKMGEGRIPRKFLQLWMKNLFSELKKMGLLPARFKEIHLAFVSLDEIRRLNKQYRGKNRPTDILSFAGFTPEEMGELVLCVDVLRAQARDHKLSMGEELGYMLIHGVLHLLGYDHETNEKEAEAMFAIQDKVFARLRQKHKK